MKRKPSMFFFVFVAVLVSFSVFSIVKASAEPNTMWEQTYGGGWNDEVRCLVQTVDGGYALAGSTRSFGAGVGDCWLVKTDGSGNMEWNQTYGGTMDDGTRCLVQTVDGGYALAGSTESFGAGGLDCWLIKTDGSGNMEWNQTYGGTDDDWFYHIVETSDGGYTLVGTTYSSGAGDCDCWLIKTDGSGNMEWGQTYGGTGWDRASCVVETSDGGYTLSGYTASFGDGGSDCWLIKTDGSGNMEWNQTYGGTLDDGAISMAKTSDGGYILAGDTASFGDGDCDCWLIKTDGNGNMEWNQTYGGTGRDYPNSLVVTSDGGYAIAGGTFSFGAGNGDCWLIKTDGNGNMEWNQTYGGTEFDEALSLIVASDGNYALAGSTFSSGSGWMDFWLSKIASSPDKTDGNGVVLKFPLWIIATVVIIAIVGAVVLVYFLKIKKTTRNPKRAQKSIFSYILQE